MFSDDFKEGVETENDFIRSHHALPEALPRA